MDTQGNNKNKWIWIGLAAAITFCCCTALVAGLIFKRIGSQVQQGIKTDPESVLTIASNIADFDMPQGYRGQMAMDFGLYSLAMLGPNSSITDGSLIMLAQFSEFGTDRQQMEDQIRQSFEQQSGRRGLDMQPVEIKKMTIRGEETDVVIYEGTDQNGNSMRQLITSFPGKDGAAMLMIMGDAENWDQQMADDFIESIH